MKFGIDYAAAPPNPAALKHSGVEFVVRYISYPGNPKNLTVAESIGLRANKIGRAIVFETIGDRALSGRAGGVEDGRSARAQTVALGLGACPVYFAVDFDAQPDQLPTVAAYIEGCASQLQWAKTGVYGGYRVIEYLAARKACRYFWQTYAWSNDAWHYRAQLHQYKNGQILAGVHCDFNFALAADYGQVDAPVHRPVANAVLRARLRAWILAQHAKHVTWRAIKKTVQWARWRRLGGH